MKKLSFLTLAMALMLTGAGCAGSPAADTSESSGDTGEGVSIFSTGMVVNDLLYNEFTGKTDGYKNFIFMEEEGTCSDVGLGTLNYDYDEDYYYHTGMAGEYEAIVSLGTSENIMTWYMNGTPEGDIVCEYTIDGESFDVLCDIDEVEYCSGTFSGMAM
jgi:hypothetical protein